MGQSPGGILIFLYLYVVVYGMYLCAFARFVNICMYLRLRVFDYTYLILCVFVCKRAYDMNLVSKYSRSN